MEVNSELKFALESSQDKGQYPNVFSADLGSDFRLETKPEYFPVIKKPREVVIEITSFRGACAWAEHYYAEIHADGIDICSKEIKNGKEYTVTHGGYVCEEYSRLPKEKKGIWDSYYSIEVTRPVTQEMINANPQRWDGYEAGFWTNAFDTKESVIEVAKRIVAARFTKDWVVKIDDLTA